MIRAHKIRLHPTSAQANYFARAAGTARFVWNWALAEWNRQYAAGEKPTALKLKKQFNEIRRAQFPWTWDVTKNASDQPFLDLSKAFTDFFKGRKTGKGKGRPKFKGKKRSKPSFYLANDQFELGDLKIWIPKLGWVNMAEKLRFTGKIKGARITKTADWWDVASHRGTCGRETGQENTCGGHRRWPLPTGNLEYLGGIRKPSLSPNGTQEATSGQQTLASTCERVKEPRESASPGRQ